MYKFFKEKSSTIQLVITIFAYGSLSNQLASGFAQFKIANSLTIPSLFFIMHIARQTFSAIMDTPMGVISDRFGHKKIVIMSQFFGYIRLLFLLSNNSTLIIISFFITSIIFVSKNGKIESSIYNMLQKHNALDKYRRYASLYYLFADMFKAFIIYLGGHVFAKYSAIEIIKIQTCLTAFSVTLCQIFLDNEESTKKDRKKYSFSFALKSAKKSITEDRKLKYLILIFLIFHINIGNGMRTFMTFLSYSFPGDSTVQANFYFLSFLVISLGSFFSAMLNEKISFNAIIYASAISFISHSIAMLYGNNYIVSLFGIKLHAIFIPFMFINFIFCSAEVAIMKKLESLMQINIRRTTVSFVTTVSSVIGIIYNLIMFFSLQKIGYFKVLQILASISSALIIVSVIQIKKHEKAKK